MTKTLTARWMPRYGTDHPSGLNGQNAGVYYFPQEIDNIHNDLTATRYMAYMGMAARAARYLAFTSDLGKTRADVRGVSQLET